MLVRVASVRVCRGWPMGVHPVEPLLRESVVVTFDKERFVEAIQTSLLKTKVRRTLIATAARASEHGKTVVSRQVIADEVGCRDLETITAHWRAAERAGFMSSHRRFNASKVIQLTIPPGDDGGRPLEDNVVTAVEEEHEDPMPAFPGELNRMSKLTSHAVREIRASYRPGHVSYAQVAAEHGVSRQLVHRIVQGQLWQESEVAEPEVSLEDLQRKADAYDMLVALGVITDE